MPGAQCSARPWTVTPVEIAWQRKLSYAVIRHSWVLMSRAAVHSRVKQSLLHAPLESAGDAYAGNSAGAHGHSPNSTDTADYDVIQLIIHNTTIHNALEEAVESLNFESIRAPSILSSAEPQQTQRRPHTRTRTARQLCSWRSAAHRRFVQPAAVPEAFRVFPEVDDLLLRSPGIEARRLVVMAEILLHTRARLIPRNVWRGDTKVAGAN